MTSIVRFDESYFVYPGNDEVWAVYHSETWSRYFVVSSSEFRSYIIIETVSARKALSLEQDFKIEIDLKRWAVCGREHNQLPKA